MINFAYLESHLSDLREEFSNASPFEYVVIDDFCDGDLLYLALRDIQQVSELRGNRSNDYIFAKNKFEKANFEEISAQLSDLKKDLLSERFENWLSALTEQKIFVDKEFHGGGLHQGGKGSFLDMHVDFNYHPNNLSWLRNINILLYLNEEWSPRFGGQLKLRDARLPGGKTVEIEPLFNRAVIMCTRDYTLHGYDPISFPEGKFRTSIAAYGYTETGVAGQFRTTVWEPTTGGLLKRFLGRHAHKAIRIKGRLFGSATEKNK